MKFNSAVLLAGFGALLAAAGAGAQSGMQDLFGPGVMRNPAAQTAPAPRTGAPTDTRARVVFWNQVALQADALDHTPPAAGENRVFGEQRGPGRASRALAIVQLAVFDSLNAIVGRYPSYSGVPRAPSDSSPDSAIARAAHDALAALYPAQKAAFDSRLAEDMARIPQGRVRLNGSEIGREAASAILALRASDGSAYTEPRVGIEFIASNAPGKWRPDPISMIPLALGAYWGKVKPFVIASAADFPLPPPPPLTSAAYTAAFNEVKQLGGDGVHTPTRRTPEQTVIGIYWAYDGTPHLGTPPRLFNQIALQIARPRTGDALELARLLALTNVAMADSAIAIWKIKYAEQNWRPVTGIREASPGTGPTGLGDGNPDTRGDPHWSPLGSPASNLIGPNFTPPFPAYPSGHAGFGGAVFQTLRRFYGTDAIGFSFVSDEYNGITRDNHGHVRPRIVRSFSRLSQAEDECNRSRIYLGVHWRYDVDQGYVLGRRIADDVFQRGLVRPAN